MASGTSVSLEGNLRDLNSYNLSEKSPKVLASQENDKKLPCGKIIDNKLPSDKTNDRKSEKSENVLNSEESDLKLPSGEITERKSEKLEMEASQAGTSKTETATEKPVVLYLPEKWSVSSSCDDDDDDDDDDDSARNKYKNGLSEPLAAFSAGQKDSEKDEYEEFYVALNDVGDEQTLNFSLFEDDEDLDEAFGDFDDFDVNFRYGRQEGERSPLPLYEEGIASVNMCIICYDRTNVRSRLCCNSNMCDFCFDSYLEYKVNEGVINIGCPYDLCKSFVHRDEILARLDEDLKEKYYRFLVDANKDPCVKTCPRCNHVRTVDKEQIQGRKRKKKGLELTCSECGLVWCFLCHAPWHANMTCRQFRKGEKLLQKWADEMPAGQLNAQKCPKCKIFIQRLSGCDHMTCSSCDTSFCYRCGKRYHNLKLFGSHYSRYSPFGCKYNLLPNRPVPRRLIRGAVFGGKLLAGVTLGALAVAAGAVLVGASFIVVPAVVGYKVRKRRRIARENRRWKERHQLRLAELAAIDNREFLLREFHQNVRVLIHRLDVDETSLDEFDTGPAVVMTSNVEEVTTEDGYTQLLAHFVSRNADAELPSPPPLPPRQKNPESETPDPETPEKNENATYETEDVDFTQNDGSFQKSKSLEAKDSSKDAAKSKSLEVKLSDPSRDVSKSKSLDPSKDISKSKSLVDAKAKDSSSKDVSKSKSLDNKTSKDGGNVKHIGNGGDLLDIELSAGESNGCFVNILSKTLNSWQGHETLPKTFATTAKGSLKFSSGTWEKSGKKCDASKDRMDVRTFTNLVAIRAEKERRSSQDGHSLSQENDYVSITTHL